MERIIAQERVYEGRVVALRIDTVRLPRGRTTQQEVVEHAPTVAVVALDEEGRVLLVRQYRHPAGKELLEIPAGTVEAGEEPEACARRELAEETGQWASEMERLGGFYLTPGYSQEYMEIYLARGLKAGQGQPEGEEEIQVVRLSPSEALKMIEQGEIEDAKSIIGLLLLFGKGAGHEPS